MGYLFAQLPDYHVQFFGESYGISTDIEDVMRDSRGFIWMSTAEHIQRFDGKNVTEFPFKGFVRTLICDNSGGIWVNSSSKISKFQNDHFGFMEYPFDTTPNVSFGRFFKPPGEDIWIQTSLGFYKWNASNQKFEPASIPELQTEAQISTQRFSIYGSTIFFDAGDSTYAVDIKRHTRLAMKRIRSQGWMNAVSDHELLVTIRGDSTAWYDLKNQRVQWIDFTNELPGRNNNFLFVRDAQPIDEHRVFLATHSGLLELNTQTKKFRRLKLYNKGYPLDPTPNYFNVTIDDDHKVWVAQSNGLVGFNPLLESIGLIRDREANDTYTWPNNARSFAEDEKGNLWIATSEGFAYWSQQDNSITMHPANPQAKDRLNTPSVRGLSYNGTYLIMGTSSGGVWLYNVKTDKFRRATFPTDSTGMKLKEKFEVDFVKQILELNDGNYLIVARDCYWMQKNNFLVKEIDISRHTKNQPNKCFVSKDGTLWLGTQDGLMTLDDKMQLKESWNLDLSITSMCELENSRFLVGSENGLFNLEFRDDSAVVTLNEILPYRTQIFFIIDDKVGKYWIGSRNGLFRYDPLTKIRERFDYADNVQGNSFAVDPVFTRKGMLVIGGINGINYFYPEKIKAKKDNLIVTILNVSVNQDDTSYYQLHNLSSLRNFQNSLEFEFVAPYYGNPQNLQYRYRLLGLSNEWKDNGNNNKVRFTKLHPDSYEFQVEASINGANWYAAQPISFMIVPPFWQTWWFITFGTMICAAFVALFLRNRIRNVRTKEQVKREYEKRIAEVEMHALRAQMNPHFMFNSLNSINNFILKNDPDNASGYLTKFSRLMRLILDNSRSEWVKLENELKALELYIELEVVRFDNVFDFEINVAPDIDMTTTSIPPMIIQPYVENAIWHGLLHRDQPGGKLCVSIWRKDDHLNITIEDNGVGREEAKRLKSKSATKHKSHGMKITAERIDIVNRIYNVNATVQIDDLAGHNGTVGGTIVTLTLQDKIYDSHHS